MHEVEREEVFDDEFPVLNGDVRFGVSLELQVGSVVKDVHDLNVHLVVAETFTKRTRKIRLVPHTHNCEFEDDSGRVLFLYLLELLIREIGKQSCKVGLCRNAVYRHYLDHSAVLLTVVNIA